MLGLLHMVVAVAAAAWLVHQPPVVPVEELATIMKVPPTLGLLGLLVKGTLAGALQALIRHIALDLGAVVPVRRAVHAQAIQVVLVVLV